jgi:predicted transcriptional regulator of viral defense system
VADLFGLDRRQAYRVIARLIVEGLADEVENGKYLLLGLEPEQVLSNPLYIGSHLVSPSYVSYWSALHFHGFSEHAPHTTFVATTKKKRAITYRDFRFRFVTIKPHKFFGYRRERIGDLPVVVADEAKAIVDSLDLPSYAGGVSGVAEGLWSALDPVGPPAVDAGTLVEYANRMANKSLGSRLGYLLEDFGQATDGLIRSASPIKLDPSRPREGHTATRWQVVVNLPDAEMARPRATG